MSSAAAISGRSGRWASSSSSSASVAAPPQVEYGRRTWTLEPPAAAAAAGEYSPGLLDLHSLDTELLTDMPVAGSYDTDAAFYYTSDQSFNESEPSFGTIKQNNVSKSSSVAKIKVVVRKRPLNKKEISRKEEDIITIDAYSNSLTVHETKLKIKESLQERIFRFQTERWTVPWTGETIAQVVILWIATFWFVGSWIVPFLAHAAGFSKETLTHRGQALYSLLTDITEGLAGIAILHQCLGRFRPLPPGWFEFNLKGRWHWDVALGCLLFPLVNLLSHININLVPMSSGPVVGVSSVQQSIVARDPVAMALYAVVVTVCAPIWEEIVFRGFLLPSLTRYMSLPWSILVSAAAFALAHFNAQRVMPLIFLGVVMGGVFARSRNLLASMVLHSLWNGFVFLDLMK